MTRVGCGNLPSPKWRFRPRNSLTHLRRVHATCRGVGFSILASHAMHLELQNRRWQPAQQNADRELSRAVEFRAAAPADGAGFDYPSSGHRTLIAIGRPSHRCPSRIHDVAGLEFVGIQFGNREAGSRAVHGLRPMVESRS
jgi:hypothetical protein